MTVLVEFLTNETNVTVDVTAPVYTIEIAPLGAKGDKGDDGTFPIISDLPPLP